MAIRSWLRAAFEWIVDLVCWVYCRFSVWRFCRVKKCRRERWFLELDCCQWLCVKHVLRKLR